MERIRTFKTFSELKQQESISKLREENNAKRSAILDKISGILDEMGIVELENLDEEQKTDLIKKIFLAKEMAEETTEEPAEEVAEEETEETVTESVETEEVAEEEAESTEESEETEEVAEEAEEITEEETEATEESEETEEVAEEETEEVVSEGTRSQFGKIDKKGNIKSVYMHYDGYPDHMLPTIKKNYKDGKNVDKVVAKGGGSGLDAFNKINFYDDGASIQGNVSKLDKYIKDADYQGGAEYVYLFDERDGKWYMADIYSYDGLKPAFEAAEVNEEEATNEANNDEKYVVIAFHEKGGGFVMTRPSSKKDAEDSARSITKSSDITKQKVVKVSDARKIRGLAGEKYLEESVNEEELNERDKAAAYKKAGKLGYNDQFLGRQSLSKTLAAELGFDPKKPWTEGIGFDHVAMYAIGKKEGTIKADALSGKYTYEDLLAMAKKFLGIKESVEVEEGNEFGAARAKAIADGEDEFEVDGKKFKVTSVDKEDKENAEEFAGESKETEVTEAEVKSAEEFKEYAFSVLKQAFGDDFDEAKAQEVVDGLVDKHGEDYGAMVGALQSSLG